MKKRSLLFVSFIFSACVITENKKLYTKKNNSDSIESISYESDNQYGHYISSVMINNNVKINYNIKMSNDGKIMNILKYDYKYYENDNKDLDAYRSLQLLISDTSEKNEPNFFGNPINGYYSDTFIVNNVIAKSTTKTSLQPLTKEEQKLFIIIDSLTKLNNIKYIHFDTSKVIGWFKYIF